MITTTGSSAWTISSVLQTSFALARDNFATFFFVAFLFNVPLVVGEMLRVGSVAIIVLSVLCSVLLGLSFTYGSLQAMSGNRPDVKTMLLQVNHPIGGRLLILGFVQTVTVFATAVLIVPGLYLLALWVVATPVMMVERTDLAGAFRRSSELTRGRRWRALIALISCFLFFIVIFAAILFPLLARLGISSESIIYHAVTLVTGSFTSMVLYCVPPVLYVFLRKEKESATVQDIVATFD
jgi:hypothetical protein